MHIILVHLHPQYAKKLSPGRFLILLHSAGLVVSLLVLYAMSEILYYFPVKYFSWCEMVLQYVLNEFLDCLLMQCVYVCEENTRCFFDDANDDANN